MSNNENLKIIAFVGLTGSGKSTAVDYLTAKGYPKVYFGGIIYGAMRQAGIDITPESQTTFREEIRKKEGNDFVVKRIISEIHSLVDAGQHRIVADGLYSWSEYKAMKHEFPAEMTTVAIIAPKHVRYRRLSERKERPFTESEAIQRDWSEIENLEKGGPIAMADHFIINDSNIDKLCKDLEAVVEDTGFYS